jgi:hypothetical protein
MHAAGCAVAGIIQAPAQAGRVHVAAEHLDAVRKYEYINIVLCSCCRARNEAADGAEVARKESLAGLKTELGAMKVCTHCAHVETACSGVVSLNRSSGQRCWLPHVKHDICVLADVQIRAWLGYTVWCQVLHCNVTLQCDIGI